MSLKRIKTLHHKLAASLALLFTLSACGGGGGGGAAEPASSTATPAVATVATVTALVPGTAMSWATAGDKTMSLTVQAADGEPAAGAAVRVFTLTRSSPQDGSALDEPVPLSLLDTVVTDAAGRASLTLQWPGHVDELLAVATLADTQGRAVLAANGGGGVVLQLTR
jgi:hypothetical protein